MGKRQSVQTAIQCYDTEMDRQLDSSVNEQETTVWQRERQNVSPFPVPYSYPFLSFHIYAKALPTFCPLLTETPQATVHFPAEKDAGTAPAGAKTLLTAVSPLAGTKVPIFLP